jgi:hypothetical protein
VTEQRERPNKHRDCHVLVRLSTLKIKSDAYNGDGRWDCRFDVNGEEVDVVLTLQPGWTKGNVAFFTLRFPDACGTDVSLDFSGAVTGGIGTDRLRGQTGDFDRTKVFRCPSSERQATFKTRVTAPGLHDADLFADFTFQFKIRLRCVASGIWL